MPLRDEPSRHPWVWLVYALLFGAAIPWYLPPEAAAVTWLGLPLWVCISITATIGVGFFTVFVIHQYWRVDE